MRRWYRLPGARRARVSDGRPPRWVSDGALFYARALVIVTGVLLLLGLAKLAGTIPAVSRFYRLLAGPAPGA